MFSKWLNIQNPILCWIYIYEKLLIQDFLGWESDELCLYTDILWNSFYKQFTKILTYTNLLVMYIYFKVPYEIYLCSLSWKLSAYGFDINMTKLLITIFLWSLIKTVGYAMYIRAELESHGYGRNSSVYQFLQSNWKNMFWKCTIQAHICCKLIQSRNIRWSWKMYWLVPIPIIYFCYSWCTLCQYTFDTAFGVLTCFFYFPIFLITKKISSCIHKNECTHWHIHIHTKLASQSLSSSYKFYFKNRWPERSM